VLCLLLKKKKKAAMIEAKVEKKPVEQLLQEKHNPFQEHHAKTGGTRHIHRNWLEMKRKKHAKKIRRIQKHSRIINRAA
jgi:hypothetical protein